MCSVYNRDISHHITLDYIEKQNKTGQKKPHKFSAHYVALAICQIAERTVIEAQYSSIRCGRII